MRVTNILKAKVDRLVTTRPDATLGEAAEIMRREGIGAVIVTEAESEQLAGIISERDIARGLAVHGDKLADMKVAEVMTPSVVTCGPDDTLEEIMQMMTSGRFRHLPVIRDGGLVGVISIGDVVKIRLEELEAETHMLQDYIRG
ncbi:MAG: CBS domain-containing protein [Rhodospirillales bacterium]|jgi:CBS domain-containing protein|nr:CBS domain-containing protein [Rhodospirillales bacterium]